MNNKKGSKKKRKHIGVGILIVVGILLILIGILYAMFFNKPKKVKKEKKENQEVTIKNPYEDLGIKEFEYPAEFTLDTDIEAAIVQLALSYNEYNQDIVNEPNWDDYFVSRFVLNSRYSFRYLDECKLEGDGVITRRQIEYMQYSLTSIDKKLSEISDTVNVKDASSGYGFGKIKSYESKIEGKEVILSAVFLYGKEGDEFYSKKCDLDIQLIKNPYSCFDGYSIKALSMGTASDVKIDEDKINNGDSLSSNEDLQTTGQGEEVASYQFVGDDLGFNENGVFTFEFLYSIGENNQVYGQYVSVDLSKNPDLASFVEKNSGKNMIVTYSTARNGDGMIESVIPDVIELE